MHLPQSQVPWYSGRGRGTSKAWSEILSQGFTAAWGAWGPGGQCLPLSMRLYRDPECKGGGKGEANLTMYCNLVICIRLDTLKVSLFIWMGLVLTSLTGAIRTEKGNSCFSWISFFFLVAGLFDCVMPAMLSAPNDQTDSSSLTFFLQQRHLLKGSPNQLFRLNTEPEQGIGTSTFRDRVFSLKKNPNLWGTFA